MIDITTGVVEDTVLLMSLIRKYNCVTTMDLKILQGNLGLSLETAMKYARQSHWMDFLRDRIEITVAGSRVLEGFDGYEINNQTWQDIIMDHIINVNPIWESRIPAGRKEAYLMMPGDVQRCFNAAGLMYQPASEDVIHWWYVAAERIRMKHNMEKDEIGREGEMYTLTYEKKRTGHDAYWESFETNLVGYDIISVKDKRCEDQLLIEVKSSKQDLDHAEMFVSRNEWETACRKIEGTYYMFYLWLLNGKVRLCKLLPKDIAPHIPIEDGAGKWEQISIPFREFKDKFANI